MPCVNFELMASNPNNKLFISHSVCRARLRNGCDGFGHRVKVRYENMPSMALIISCAIQFMQCFTTTLTKQTPHNENALMGQTFDPDIKT